MPNTKIRVTDLSGHSPEERGVQVTGFMWLKEKGGCVNKNGHHYSLQREKGRRFHWKMEKELAMLIRRVE